MYREAVRSPASKQWELAIAAKYEQLWATKMFEWVYSPLERRKAIGSRIVFHEKDTFGKTVKYKNRLDCGVAKCEKSSQRVVMQ